MVELTVTFSLYEVFCFTFKLNIIIKSQEAPPSLLLFFLIIKPNFQRFLTQIFQHVQVRERDQTNICLKRLIAISNTSSETELGIVKKHRNMAV